VGEGYGKIDGMKGNRVAFRIVAEGERVYKLLEGEVTGLHFVVGQGVEK
jgi:hypothetical protein